MTRFCTICREPIPPQRLNRGSAYCGDECRRVAKNEARAELARKKCRLCGRRYYKPGAAKAVAPGAQLFPVKPLTTNLHREG